MDQAPAVAAAQATQTAEVMTSTEFMIRVSYNYHKKRERFFRIMDALSKVISLFALTTLAAAWGPLAIAFGAVSGLATILAIVLDYTGMASKHESLARQFLQLIGEIVAKRISIEDAAMRRAEIEAQEPTTLRGLSQLCCDEEDAARGEYVEPERLTHWRRIRAHFGYGDMPIPGQ